MSKSQQTTSKCVKSWDLFLSSRRKHKGYIQLAKRNKVLFLTLNTFSSIGGIEDVCKNFCKVLQDTSSSFKVLSLNDDSNDPKYLDSKNFKGFRGRKVNYGLQVIRWGLKHDVLVLSHINLILFAWILKALNPKLRIKLYAHGIEVWRTLPKWKVRFLRKNVELWAVSEFTAQDLHNRHGIELNRITVVNNCLNPFLSLPKTFEKPAFLIERYNLKKDQPVLFSLTRISKYEKFKGYDIIIDLLPELFVNYPNLVYILSGKADDCELERITNKIKQLNLEKNVLLTGMLIHEELSSHFLLADCFILPSKKEGFGIVFIEAAACGCRIIAGNKDGSRDAVLNGELGALVDPENPTEIRATIEKVLAAKKSHEEATRIQKTCLENFSFDRYKVKVTELLNRING